ncbi:MAG: Rieske (2Fe-2S) protein [Candidatus Hydrogenedentales bacterium]|jgi:cytochrome b6-f complex iron-sulfur subunit
MADDGQDSKVQDAAEESMPRRVFFAAGAGLVGACYAGAIGYPVYRFLSTPAHKSAAEEAALREVSFSADKLPAPGTAYLFKFGSHNAILIRLEDSSLVCFDRTCTHLGCTVEFQPKEKRIHCACHGGVYDMNTGKNVSGPPPKPLKQYRVEVTADGQVVISRA